VCLKVSEKNEDNEKNVGRAQKKKIKIRVIIQKKKTTNYKKKQNMRAFEKREREGEMVKLLSAIQPATDKKKGHNFHPSILKCAFVIAV
jgi:hypothetical protein